MEAAADYMRGNRMERKTFNPVMLTMAREARGYTQMELAQAAKMLPARLTDMEYGFSEPTDDELRAFMTILEFPKGHFFREGKRYPAIARGPSGCHFLGYDGIEEADRDPWSKLDHGPTARDTLAALINFSPGPVLHEVIDTIIGWREKRRKPSKAKPNHPKQLPLFKDRG